MAIIPFGSGNNIELEIKFNSHIRDAYYFFDFAEKELRKRFVVKEMQEPQDKIDIYAVTPAIFIENNMGKNWEHCRLKIIKLDNEKVLGRLCWREILAINDIQYECNCLDGSKIFVNFDNLTNQNNLRAIKRAQPNNKNILVGNHTLEIEFKASDLSGVSITKYITIEIEFQGFIENKYGVYNHPKILKVK